MDIHCKVLFGEEYRRFVVKNNDFKSLYETVKKLFNLSDGCVLKYKDDERDLVTMSSDEELLCALEFSSGILHLFVVSPNEPSETEFPARNCRGKENPHCHMGHMGHMGHVGHPPHHPGGPFPFHPGHGHVPSGGPFFGHPHCHRGWERRGCMRENMSENKWEKKWERKWEKNAGKDVVEFEIPRC